MSLPDGSMDLPIGNTSIRRNAIVHVVGMALSRHAYDLVDKPVIPAPFMVASEVGAAAVGRMEQLNGKTVEELALMVDPPESTKSEWEHWTRLGGAIARKMMGADPEIEIPFEVPTVRPVLNLQSHKEYAG